MDWDAAERRHDPASVERRLWAGLRPLIAARRATRAVHAQTTGDPFWTGNDHVFGLERRRAGERLIVLANFTSERQAVDLGVLHGRGAHLDPAAAAPDGRDLRVEGDVLVLEPYQFAWLSD